MVAGLLDDQGGALATGIAAAGGGTTVNTSSFTGLTGLEYVGAYAVTKHASVGLTRVARWSRRRRGYGVKAVCPGVVDTAMTDPGDRASAEAVDRSPQSPRP